MHLYRALLTVLLSSYIYIATISFMVGTLTQYLALRTYQMVSTIVEASLLDHVPFLVRMDRNICRDAQVVEMLPQTPIVVSGVRGQTFMADG